MKKLFCLSILTLGIFISVQAQALFYQLENVSSTETWIYKMQDNNGNILNFATIPPGGTWTGTFNPVGFPIEWAAEDSNGCGANGTITGPTGPVYPPVTCGIPPAAMKYRVSPVFGGNFFLEFVFD